jgi:hypothetical protein
MKVQNNRKQIVIALIAFLLVSAILLGIGSIPAVADVIYPNPYAQVQTIEPHLINNRATQMANQTEAEHSSNNHDPATIVTPPDTPSSLQSMVQGFENKTFTQTGWLHYVYHLESEVDNGVALPQNYYCDGWYFVGEKGNVEKHIIGYLDESGNLNQQEIFKNNTFTNLTTNEKMEADSSYRLRIDFGVTKYASEMEMEGAILTRDVCSIDNEPVVKFTLTGNFDKPTIIGNSSQPVKSVRMTTVVDESTGAVSEVEYVYILIDGTEELFYRIQTKTIEWDDLPNEFVQIMKDKE